MLILTFATFVAQVLALLPCTLDMDLGQLEQMSDLGLSWVYVRCMNFVGVV